MLSNLFPHLKWVSFSSIPERGNALTGQISIWRRTLEKLAYHRLTEISPGDGLVETAATILSPGSGIEEYVIPIYGPHSIALTQVYHFARRPKRA